MYTVFVNIVVGFRCKVTTFFRILYQLPMENEEMAHNHKRLQIRKLQKETRCASWKITDKDMENETGSRENGGIRSNLLAISLISKRHLGEV